MVPPRQENKFPNHVEIGHSVEVSKSRETGMLGHWLPHDDKATSRDLACHGPEATPSIRRRLLHMINDEDIDRGFLGLKFEAELFLQRGG